MKEKSPPSGLFGRLFGRLDAEQRVAGSLASRHGLHRPGEQVRGHAGGLPLRAAELEKPDTTSHPVAKSVRIPIMTNKTIAALIAKAIFI